MHIAADILQGKAMLGIMFFDIDRNLIDDIAPLADILIGHELSQRIDQ